MSARMALIAGVGALALVGAKVATSRAPEPCGVACARLVLRTRHAEAHLTGIRTRPNGMMSVQEVADLLTANGLRAESRPVASLDALAGSLPAILHLERGHFVVVDRIGPREVRVTDPTYGASAFTYPRHTLEREWSGLAVVASR